MNVKKKMGNGGSEEALHLVKSLGMQNIRQVRAHIHTLVLVLVKGSEGKEARNHTVASGNMKKEKDELVVIIDHELGTNVITRIKRTNLMPMNILLLTLK